MKRPYRKWFYMFYIAAFFFASTPLIGFANVPKLICGVPALIFVIFLTAALVDIALIINYKLDCKYDAMVIAEQKKNEKQE